ARAKDVTECAFGGLRFEDRFEEPGESSEPVGVECGVLCGGEHLRERRLQDGARQLVLAGEMPVRSADSDASSVCDVVEGCGQPALLEHLAASGDQRLTVARRVL